MAKPSPKARRAARRQRGLLTEHMFIGLVLIPPLLLTLASTGFRFARYYAGAPGAGVRCMLVATAIADDVPSRRHT